MAIPSSASLLTFSLLVLASLTLSHSAVVCNPNDKKTLLQIKNHFNNVASVFDSFDPKTDCCFWSNVVCNDEDHPGRVTTFIVGYSNGVVGQIPPIVGDLPYLTYLGFVQLPNLIGLIPQTLTKLTRLQVLDLSSNHLSGPIPEFLSQMKSLQQVLLSSNSFSGPIPASLSLLPSLSELDLSKNKLTGSIPQSFGSFKTGLNLQVFENLLSGSIPRSLGQANLTNLDVTGNRFAGDVSFLFARDKALVTIVLRLNKFKFDFTNVDLPQFLAVLDIAHNHIYGSLPKRLGQLPLSYIDVSYNHLCGPIPTGRRLKRFLPERFAHNKCLCGLPLPPCKK